MSGFVCGQVMMMHIEPNRIWKTPTSKSYFWIYLSGTDGKAPIVLYNYAPGRSRDYPIEFLSGFHGAFCNRLFFQERLLKGLSAEERKQKRLETESGIWDEFWSWLDTLIPTGGSKLEKAINSIIYNPYIINSNKKRRWE